MRGIGLRRGVFERGIGLEASVERGDGAKEMRKADSDLELGFPMQKQVRELHLIFAREFTGRGIFSQVSTSAPEIGHLRSVATEDEK
jgi:hypothetical protein